MYVFILLVAHLDHCHVLLVLLSTLCYFSELFADAGVTFTVKKFGATILFYLCLLSFIEWLFSNICVTVFNRVLILEQLLAC